MSEAKKGSWRWIRDSNKRHYFVGGQSLCGKRLGLRFGKLEMDNDESNDNCTVCKKILLRMKTQVLSEKLNKEGKIIL